MVGQAVAAITLLLLGASGVAKAVDPDPTSGALRAAGLPSSRLIARSLGVTELTAALLGLSATAMALIPAAVVYAGFTIFTLAAIRGRIPVQSCGCFGRDDTPPSWIHVVYNSSATVSLVWVAMQGTTPIPWNANVAEILLFTVFAVLGAYASYLMLASLPLHPTSSKEGLFQVLPASGDEMVQFTASNTRFSLIVDGTRLEIVGLALSEEGGIAFRRWQHTVSFAAGTHSLVGTWLWDGVQIQATTVTIRAAG